MMVLQIAMFGGLTIGIKDIKPEEAIYPQETREVLAKWQNDWNVSEIKHDPVKLNLFSMTLTLLIFT